MVAEILPGVFRCERFGCPQTVAADRPSNKRSRGQAQRAAAAHEARNAIHLAILDLSTLPPKPNATREGFVVVGTTTEGLDVLSSVVYGDRVRAEMEASLLIEIVASADLTIEERRGRGRLPRPGSVAASQRDADSQRLIGSLLNPPVVAFPKIPS